MFSKAQVKGAAVGLAWFIGYAIAWKYVVRPAAVKFKVPVLSTL